MRLLLNTHAFLSGSSSTTRSCLHLRKQLIENPANSAAISTASYWE